MEMLIFMRFGVVFLKIEVVVEMCFKFFSILIFFVFLLIEFFLEFQLDDLQVFKGGVIIELDVYIIEFFLLEQVGDIFLNVDLVLIFIFVVGVYFFFVECNWNCLLKFLCLKLGK